MSTCNIQHGFRKNKSVVSATTEFLESVIDSIDRGYKVLGVFMDPYKTFDSVCHLKIINKLTSIIFWQERRDCNRFRQLEKYSNFEARAKNTQTKRTVLMVKSLPLA